MEPSEAVVQATIRHALDAGYLDRQQLREALLLQDQLQAAGRSAPLLTVIAAKFVRPEHVPALKRRYQELLAKQTNATLASAPPPLEEPELQVPQDVLSRSCELAARPPAEDPEPVRRFLDESSPADDVDDRVFVSLAKRAGYPSTDVLRACRQAQLERRRRGEGAASLFALACARGALDERARQRFLRWAAQIAQRKAEPLSDDGGPTNAPPRVLHASAEDFQVEPAPRCGLCGADLEDVAADDGKALCGACTARSAAPPPPPQPRPASARVAPAAPPAPPPQKKRVRKALRESAAFIARGLSRKPPAEGDPPRAPRLVAILAVVGACGALAGVVLAVAVALTRGPKDPVVDPSRQAAADASWRFALALPPDEAADGLRRFAREHAADPRAGDAVTLATLLEKRAPAPSPDEPLLERLLAEGRRLADTEPAAAHAVLDAAVTAGRLPDSSEAARARDATRGRALAALNRARSELRPLARHQRERALAQALELAARWRGLGQDEELEALVLELARPPASEPRPARDPSPIPPPPAWATAPPAETPAEPPTVTPTPDALPAPTERPASADAPASADVWSLYLEAYPLFDAEDAPGVAAVLARLERAAPDAPETHAVRGFHLSLTGRHAEAAQALARATKVDDVRVPSTFVRSAFLSASYDEARAAVPRLEPDERAEWLTLLDGPFRRGAPLAAGACETLSPERRYRVVSDVGVDLVRLEARLAQAKPEERDELVARARRGNRALNEIADIMDKAAKAYGNLLSVEPRERVVPTVYVFSSKAGFSAFSQALGMGSTERTLGYYAPYWRILCFYEEVARKSGGGALSPETMETLLHETFHQWLHLYVSRAPHWFNEGLADYFGFSEITAEGLRYGLLPTHHPSRLDNLRSALTRGSGYPPPLPLPTLLRADRATFMDPAQSSVNYAHAWSFVHFLAASRGGRKVIKDYFLALRDGKDLEGAFMAVFGGKLDLDQLEREWRAHVDGLR